MNMGVFNKAVQNMPKGKDTTPTLDAQVKELPESNENEKQIVIQRPDTDADKNVNLPATSSGGALVPPEPPQFNPAALENQNTEIAPVGNRDVAEDAEFVVNAEEPEQIEGYKQAGESWVENEEPDEKREPQKLLEEETEGNEEGEEETEKNNEKKGDDEKKDGDNKNPDKNNTKKSPKKNKDDEKEEGKVSNGNGLKDLLNSGASNFSINDIVESEPDVPHYQYRSLLNRR